MKKSFRLLLILLTVVLVFSSCNDFSPDAGTSSQASINGSQINSGTNCEEHVDSDDNGKCDLCRQSVIVSIDFYAINDLHGKFKDTESNGGVDELSTYLKSRRSSDENVILLSSGDMWQGSSESNLTRGNIITEWMNDLDFASMTLGNHEYDWGEELVEENAELAEFPFLAINVFDRETNARVDYCQASTVVECDGIQIGIIGAIGDCYSSISGDKSEGFYIKTGSELTALVKNESERLRAEGVDFIVYSIHDGYEDSTSFDKSVSRNDLSYYYNTSLSNGYVDLVFEGHTHQNYVLVDEYGVYHLQNGGENKGISHAEIRINSVTGRSRTRDAEFVSSSIYANLTDDKIVSELLEKYKDEIAIADVVLGNNVRKRYSNELKQLVSKLYFEYGSEIWGSEYDIVLGGGFISSRSPYNLEAGEVRYSHIQSILPFDNELVLCSVSGRDLASNFFFTENENYYITFGSYGESVKNNIDYNATYYIITDTYSSSYAPNNLTVIEKLNEIIYARDLVAEYIKAGGFAK